MIRKLLVAFLLVGVSFIATSPRSEASWCEPAPVKPCDVVCAAPGATQGTVCDCPCWTDRRVVQSTCGRWNSLAGCWWL